MAEDEDKKKAVEVEETKDEREMGGEERPTSSSEGEKLALLIKCSQYADRIY